MKNKSLFFIIISIFISVILSLFKHPAVMVLNYVCVVLTANIVFQREKDIMNAAFVGSMLTASVRCIFMLKKLSEQKMLNFYHISSVLEMVLSLVSIALIMSCLLSKLLIDIRKNKWKIKRSKNEVV